MEAGGESVPLTAKEFDLLEYLMRRAGAVVRREELLGAVWGYSGGEETRTVDVHIRALRLKLGEAGKLIKTVRGVGYMAENEVRPMMYKSSPERRDAPEDMRREFTANVSHELKTPITSISGYAEMMVAGIAGGRTGRSWRRRYTTSPAG